MKNIINVYEQVDINKQRSMMVIVLFVIFVLGFVWTLSKILGSNSSLIIIAIIFSLASSVGGYFWGDKIILAISRAKPANKNEHFNFYTAAENLAITSQIPVPKLYVIESSAMNAFATGRDPKHAVICLTTGLLEKLDRNEVEAVVAHETSHILNYDIRLMTIVAVLVGTVTLLSDWAFRGLSSKRDRQGISPVVLIVGILTVIFAPLIGKLVQLAISRRREYLADASAVKLTRYPQGLINALRKLAASRQPLRTASPATAHLYIVNPLKQARGGFRKIARLFSTHPPIKERIIILEKML